MQSGSSKLRKNARRSHWPHLFLALQPFASVVSSAWKACSLGCLQGVFQSSASQTLMCRQVAWRYGENTDLFHWVQAGHKILYFQRLLLDDGHSLEGDPLSRKVLDLPSDIIHPGKTRVTFQGWKAAIIITCGAFPRITAPRACIVIASLL